MSRDRVSEGESQGRRVSFSVMIREEISIRKDAGVQGGLFCWKRSLFCRKKEDFVGRKESRGIQPCVADALAWEFFSKILKTHENSGLGRIRGLFLQAVPV
jgi:hypothetical protein